MPPQSTHTRQQPASCDSCRKKKLRCDRAQPCANCNARAISCEYQGRKASDSADLLNTIKDDTDSLRAENALMRARLEKLEGIVLSSSGASTGRKSSTTGSSPDIPHAPGSNAVKEYIRSTDYKESASRFQNDLHWLEGQGVAENSRLPALDRPMKIRIESVRDIVLQAGTTRDDRRILLPPEPETLNLFDSYLQLMDPAQHIIHTPTARSAIKQLFQDLYVGYSVEPNRTVLLLSILASISGYWALLQHGQVKFFESMQQAADSAFVWLRTTLDVLEHVRRSGSATIETVQASIITFFLIYNIDGMSPKVRATGIAAISLAKDLGLHRVDAPTRDGSMPAQDRIIEDEIKRRVWWHLASSDWSFSVAGGPHTGTYSIHPNHMNVRKPRNTSDEELASQPADFDHPVSEPTIMAYSLHRIRLGEISRRITDMGFTTSQEEPSFEDIQAIDLEFQRVLSQIPIFLRLDAESTRQSQHLHQLYPYLRLQRYIINITTQVPRCKFYLPCLLRSAHDEAYLPFRSACLHAARALIEANNGILTDQSSSGPSSSRLSGPLHLLFYAIVVLVMDICVNSNIGDEVERKAELRDACKMLEEARTLSSAAGLFLDSLMAILRKHRIGLGERQDQHTMNVSDDMQQQEEDGDATTVVKQLELGDFDMSKSYDTDFDSFWQSFINDGSVEMLDWDALMNDIEMVH